MRNGVKTVTKEVETTWAGPPSIEMEGVDDEGKAACAKREKSFMSLNQLSLKADPEGRANAL